MPEQNLPLGYRYAAAYAGIRKVRKDDLALIVPATPAAGAAVFTQNRARAAPVVLSRKNLQASGGRVGALVINAGNANCATRTGKEVALETARATAQLLKVPASYVLPSSTGVIGVELDAKKIVKALPRLVEGLSETAFDAVAQAIMTTDLVPKTAFGSIQAGRGTIRIAGMTKGSGMIHPLMATTLGYVMTDAQLDSPVLAGILARTVESSYNRMTVDGDTSTNDTVVLLANGGSGIEPTGRDLAAYEAAVAGVMQSLAQQIARDGEGARKLVTIDVSGARTAEDAGRIARAIANSPLVKTAIAGADPNWGRILMASGNAGVAFDPAKVDIDMQGLAVCRGGLAARFSEKVLSRKLAKADCWIDFRIRGNGKGKTRFWTCDLTHGYIEINASYRT